SLGGIMIERLDPTRAYTITTLIHRNESGVEVTRRTVQPTPGGRLFIDLDHDVRGGETLCGLELRLDAGEASVTGEAEIEKDSRRGGS
ncbi:MAG: hypothetical protein AAGK78_08225, partial [Planctomycetota bacterium]